MEGSVFAHQNYTTDTHKWQKRINNTQRREHDSLISKIINFSVRIKKNRACVCTYKSCTYMRKRNDESILNILISTSANVFE